MLFEYYCATELSQSSGGDFEHVKSFASKSAEQAARISGVLTLWKDVNAHEVSVETMADAIDLAQFYLREAKRLAEAAMITERIEQAEHLRCWILNCWPDHASKLGRDSKTILPRDVVLYGPGAFRETPKAKALLSTLVEHQWLHQLDAGTRRVICGARTRLGRPCRALSEPGKKRCKFHGGKSTGPKTEAGRQRIAEAQRRRWAAYRAEKSQGQIQLRGFAKRELQATLTQLIAISLCWQSCLSTQRTRKPLGNLFPRTLSGRLASFLR